MNARRILLMAGVALLTGGAAPLVAGCGSAAGDNRSEASGAAFAPTVAAPEAAGSVSQSSSATGGKSSGSLPTSADSAGGDIVVGTPGADIARSVTAAYTVPTGSFLTSFDTVIADGVALGGYVISSQTSPDKSGRIVSGEVTLAIPTAQLASLLNTMPSDFTASAINFASVDDTASIVDVSARLTSAQAHLTALQALLAKATSLDDITTLEQQIEDVETSIDTDQGQLSTLDQAVAYATATIQLKERGAVTVVAATGPSVTSGVSKGWTNALAIITVALEVLVTAIPAAVVALIGWLLWRRPRRSAAARAKASTSA